MYIVFYDTLALRHLLAATSRIHVWEPCFNSITRWLTVDAAHGRENDMYLTMLMGATQSDA